MITLSNVDARFIAQLFELRRDVMKESISAAASYVRSRAVDFGIEPSLFDRRDIHVPRARGRDPKGRPVGRRRHDR